MWTRMKFGMLIVYHSSKNLRFKIGSVQPFYFPELKFTDISQWSTAPTAEKKGSVAATYVVLVRTRHNAYANTLNISNNNIYHMVK